GDLNGDGKDDLVIVGANAASYQVLLSNGNGTYTPKGTAANPSGVFPAGEGLFDAELGDVDGDGHLDLIVAGGKSGSIYVHRGNGDGTFQAPLVVPTLPVAP